ncbi:MAG: hypothetical protein HYS22_06160 [Deltaproteobacteria bacterium]|nr:hypothetical protein [Deltaproteobacteria bacterium]
MAGPGSIDPKAPTGSPPSVEDGDNDPSGFVELSPDPPSPGDHFLPVPDGVEVTLEDAPPVIPSGTGALLVGPTGEIIPAAPAVEEAIFEDGAGMQRGYFRFSPLSSSAGDIVVYLTGPDSHTDLSTHILIQTLTGAGFSTYTYIPPFSLDIDYHTGTLSRFLDRVRGENPGRRIHLVTCSSSAVIARRYLEESPAAVSSFVAVVPAFEITQEHAAAWERLGKPIPANIYSWPARPVETPALFILAGDDRSAINDRSLADLRDHFGGYRHHVVFPGRQHEIFLTDTGERRLAAMEVTAAVARFLLERPYEPEFPLTLHDGSGRNACFRQAITQRTQFWEGVAQIFQEVASGGIDLETAGAMFYEAHPDRAPLDRLPHYDPQGFGRLLREMMQRVDHTRYYLANTSETSRLEPSRLVERLDEIEHLLFDLANEAEIIFYGLSVYNISDATNGDRNRFFRVLHHVANILVNLVSENPEQVRNGFEQLPAVLVELRGVVGDLALVGDHAAVAVMGEGPLFPEGWSTQGDLHEEEKRVRAQLGERRALFRQVAMRRLQRFYWDHREVWPEAVRAKAAAIDRVVNHFLALQRKQDGLDVRGLVQRYLTAYPDVADYLQVTLDYYGATLNDLETLPMLLRIVIERYNTAATAIYGDITTMEHTPEETWQGLRVQVRAAAALLSLLDQIPPQEGLGNPTRVRPDILAVVRERLEAIRALIERRVLDQRPGPEPQTVYTWEEVTTLLSNLDQAWGEVVAAALLIDLSPELIARFESLRAHLGLMIAARGRYRSVSGTIHAVIYRLYTNLAELMRGAHQFPSVAGSSGAVGEEPVGERMMTEMERDLDLLDRTLAEPVSAAPAGDAERTQPLLGGADNAATGTDLKGGDMSVGTVAASLVGTSVVAQTAGNPPAGDGPVSEFPESREPAAPAGDAYLQPYVPPSFGGPERPEDYEGGGEIGERGFEPTPFFGASVVAAVRRLVARGGGDSSALVTKVLREIEELAQRVELPRTDDSNVAYATREFELSRAFLTDLLQEAQTNPDTALASLVLSVAYSVDRQRDTVALLRGEARTTPSLLVTRMDQRPVVETRSYARLSDNIFWDRRRLSYLEGRLAGGVPVEEQRFFENQRDKAGWDLVSDLRVLIREHREKLLVSVEGRGALDGHLREFIAALDRHVAVLRRVRPLLEKGDRDLFRGFPSGLAGLDQELADCAFDLERARGLLAILQDPPYGPGSPSTPTAAGGSAAPVAPASPASQGGPATPAASASSIGPDESNVSYDVAAWATLWDGLAAESPEVRQRLRVLTLGGPATRGELLAAYGVSADKFAAVRGGLAMVDNGSLEVGLLARDLAAVLVASGSDAAMTPAVFERAVVRGMRLLGPVPASGIPGEAGGREGRERFGERGAREPLPVRAIVP